MDIATIGTVLNIILSLVSGITDNKTVTNIIAILEKWLPVVLQEAQDLVPVVQGIIDSLKGSDVLTPGQIAAVDALNAKVDADFDAAAAKFEG